MLYIYVDIYWTRPAGLRWCRVHVYYYIYIYKCIYVYIYTHVCIYIYIYIIHIYRYIHWTRPAGLRWCRVHMISIWIYIQIHICQYGAGAAGTD